MTGAILLHLTESSPEPLRSQIARQLRDREAPRPATGGDVAGGDVTGGGA